VDFDLSEEQQRYREAVLAFAARDLDDDVIARDEEHQFSRDAWKRCAAFGILGLPVPEEYGGSGADALSIAVALEALGYGCKDNGLLFSLGAHMWSCEIPIVRFGSEDQRQRYLPGLCDGSLIGVQCMTEPGSGSDAFSLTTTARGTENGYVLSGSKTFITNATVADVFVVFASTDPGKGWAGITAFLVDAANPGVTVGAPFHKMGLRTSPMAEVFFDDCEIPEDAVLGRPGAGARVFATSMEWERSLILACALGTLERQLERCLDYARTRTQFSQPIGKFQAVSHKLVDMRIRLETARLLVHKTAWLLGRGKSVAMESAMAKLYLSECYLQSSLDALQIHGGSGYMAELEFERDVRDAIGSRIYSGTSEIQRNIIARLMRL
jgi:alkylation response protein AidB-like acyl-CoA dehydrogenase